MHYKRLSKLRKGISIFKIRSILKIVKQLKLTQKIRLYSLLLCYCFSLAKAKLKI